MKDYLDFNRTLALGRWYMQSKWSEEHRRNRFHVADMQSLRGDEHYIDTNKNSSSLIQRHGDYS